MQLGIPDVVRIMQVPEHIVHRWIKSGGLPAHHVSGKHYINRLALFEWATNRHLRQAPAILADDPTGPGEREALAAALELGGASYGIPASDRQSALRGVAERLKLPCGVERQTVVDLLLGRVIVGLSSAGDGIVVPHPRYPIVLPLWNPLIFVCGFDRPVDLGTGNGESLTTMFVITAPTVRRHQVLLTYIMAALREPGFRSLIRNRASCESIVGFVRRSYGQVRTAHLPDGVSEPLPMAA
jgi:hypothetical protein